MELGLGRRGLVAVEWVVEGAWVEVAACRRVYLVVMRVVLGCAFNNIEDCVSHSWAVSRCGILFFLCA